MPQERVSDDRTDGLRVSGMGGVGGLNEELWA